MSVTRRSAKTTSQGTPLKTWAGYTAYGILQWLNLIDNDTVSLLDTVGQSDDTIITHPSSHEARINQNTTNIGSNSSAIAALQGNFPITLSEISSEAWAAYAPVLTASSTNPTLGNGSLVGAYVKIGRTVHFRIKLMTGNTTAAGSGNYYFSLPVAPVTDSLHSRLIGTAEWIDGSNGNEFGGFCRIRSSSATSGANLIDVMYLNSGAGTARISNVGSAFMSWQANSVVYITGTYEAAP